MKDNLLHSFENVTHTSLSTISNIKIDFFLLFCSNQIPYIPIENQTLDATISEVEALLARAGQSVSLVVCSNPSGYHPYKRTTRSRQVSIRRSQLRRTQGNVQQLNTEGIIKHVMLRREKESTPWGLSICGSNQDASPSAGVFVAQLTPKYDILTDYTT